MASMSDICLCTSAAPIYFLVHFFVAKDTKGETHTFDLVDGQKYVFYPHYPWSQKYCTEK